MQGRGIAGAIAGITLGLLPGPGCRRDAADPERVVERFAAAALTGNRDEVLRLLGPETRQRLQEIMRSAERVSGRLVLGPQDFLSVGLAPPSWEMAGVRTLHADNTRAIVEVYSATGDRHEVLLVIEDGTWKIELPGP